MTDEMQKLVDALSDVCQKWIDDDMSRITAPCELCGFEGAGGSDARLFMELRSLGFTRKQKETDSDPCKEIQSDGRRDEVRGEQSELE